MNYFLLAETEFFRRINEAGDCNMETAYTAFATQVIELCSGNVDTNRTIIALAYIEIELQHHPMRNLPEEKREVAAYISKALSLVRKMQKFLAAPQVPPLIPIRTSSDNTTENPASPLQWTGNAIDLVELIYGINEMGCINNGNMPLKQLAPLQLSGGFLELHPSAFFFGYQPFYYVEVVYAHIQFCNVGTKIVLFAGFRANR